MRRLDNYISVTSNLRRIYSYLLKDLTAKHDIKLEQSFLHLLRLYA